MNNNDITAILPIHDVSDDFNPWFDRAIKSLEQSILKPGKLLLVCAEEDSIKEFITKWEAPSGIDTEIIYNDKSTDFCGQINFGVEHVKTEFFSILPSSLL